MQLPDEVILQIVGFVATTHRELYELLRTCRQFHRVIFDAENEISVWLYVAEQVLKAPQRFPSSAGPSTPVIERFSESSPLSSLRDYLRRKQEWRLKSYSEATAHRKQINKYHDLDALCTSVREKYPDFRLHQGFDILINICGGPTVGKSALCLRILSDVWIEEHDPWWGDPDRKDICVSGIVSTIDFGMVSTEEPVSNRSCFLSGDGYCFMYDVCRRSTFNSVLDLWEEIVRFKETSKIACVLVANMIDDPESQHEVAPQEGRDLASRIGAEFFEISVKMRINIDEMFTRIVHDAHVNIVLSSVEWQLLQKSRIKKCSLM